MSKETKLNAFLYIGPVWVVLQLVSHMSGAIASGLFPEKAMELSIALWPPRQPLRSWLMRVWVLPFYRWDANMFVEIARDGYTLNSGTLQFHPLFPYLARALVVILGFSPLFALCLISTLSSGALIYVFYLLVRARYGNKSAVASCLLLMTSPLAFALYVPYSEATFLLFACLCFYGIQQEQWGLAGLASALATLTRQQGVLLLVPLVIALLEVEGWQIQNFFKRKRDLLVVSLAPLAYGGWVLYRTVFLEGFAWRFSDIQTFIYSVLISPKAREVVPVQGFVWPWIPLWRGVASAAEPGNLLNMMLALWFLIMLFLVSRKLRPYEWGYVLAVVIISFSYYTGPRYPNMGLPRHLLLALPVFTSLGAVPLDRLTRILVFAFSLLILQFVLFLFVGHLWVP